MARGYYGEGFCAGDLVRWRNTIRPLYTLGSMAMPGDTSICCWELLNENGSVAADLIDSTYLALVQAVEDIEYQKVRHLAP